MDILTALRRDANYTKTQLQLILGAWVMSTVFEKQAKISTTSGDVSEEDYDKRSIYSLLYALPYRSMGEVKSADGRPYMQVHVQHLGLRVAGSLGPVPEQRGRPASALVATRTAACIPLR